jgi:hypothetical protein
MRVVSNWEVAVCGSLAPKWYALSDPFNTLTHLIQSAQQSQGIQTLLEAEKEAAKIVQQARQCPSPHSLYSFSPH